MPDDEIATYQAPGPEPELIASVTDDEWQAAKAAQRAAVDPDALPIPRGHELFALEPLTLHLGAVTCPVTMVVGEHDHPHGHDQPGRGRELQRRRAHRDRGRLPQPPRSPHPDRWRTAIEAHFTRLD